MKRTIFFLLITVLAGTFLFYDCKKKEYARLNPLDPLYSGAAGDTNGGTIPGGPISHTGTISFDRTGYQGITNHATITVVDADLTSTSLTVNVKSLTDPTGINFKLTGAAGTYTGKLGFTNNTSVSNWKINITNNDTITATYIDADPAGTRTDTAVIITNTPILTNFLGLYDETYTTPLWDNEIQLFIWDQDGGGPLISPLTTADITDPVEARDGTKYQSGTISTAGSVQAWWGWGICAIAGLGNPTTHNRSEYSGGTLHLHIKAFNNNSIRVGIKDTVNHWVSLSSYGYTADGSWYTITIPFTDFGAVDFTQISYYFMMDNGGGARIDGECYRLDHIYWSKP